MGEGDRESTLLVRMHRCSPNKLSSLYFAGEALKVTVDINNHSTRSVKPKFTLYEKSSFSAKGLRKVNHNEVLKEKVEAVASSSRVNVTKVIPLPRDLPPSILNCSIIKLEYMLEVNFFCGQKTAVLPFLLL